MKQGLLLWRPCPHTLSPPSLPFPISITKRTILPISASLESTNTQQLTARERRQLRNERRESNNWREQVEERLIKKPKKRYASWTEELNLDNLALLGPQWWVVRVSRIRGPETAQLLARLLAKNFPQIDFKVYVPAVEEKRKLKNGSYSVKSKPLFPGCVFLRCILNRDIHDFIRECEGVGGFVGSKVGNTKKQINKPRPVSVEDMEAIFRQAKEEQEKSEQASVEEQQGEGLRKFEKLIVDSNDATQLFKDSKPKRLSKIVSGPLANSSSPGKIDKLLVPGATVRIVSGTFEDFVGNLKKLNRKTKKATVGFTLFGKESLVELDVKEIVAEKE